MVRANVEHEKAVQYGAQLDSCEDDMSFAVTFIKILHERNNVMEKDNGLLMQENVLYKIQNDMLLTENKKLRKQTKVLKYFCLGFGMLATGITVGLYVTK